MLVEGDGDESLSLLGLLLDEALLPHKPPISASPLVVAALVAAAVEAAVAVAAVEASSPLKSRPAHLCPHFPFAA